MAGRKGRRRMCMFCGAVVEGDYEVRSAFTHSHPTECPKRNDRMPSLNGVHVGDIWGNCHVPVYVRVVEIRMGGFGTYTNWEPCFVLCDIDLSGWQPIRPKLFGETDERPTLADLEALPLLERSYSRQPAPMWALVEHWDPITRPGEFPVPWRLERRWGGAMRSVLDEWRGSAYRHPSDPSRNRKGAYWHAFHVSEDGACLGRFEWWQLDPDTGRPVVDEDEELPRVGSLVAERDRELDPQTALMV